MNKPSFILIAYKTGILKRQIVNFIKKEFSIGYNFFRELIVYNSIIINIVRLEVLKGRVLNKEIIAVLN